MSKKIFFTFSAVVAFIYINYLFYGDKVFNFKYFSNKEIIEIKEKTEKEIKEEVLKIEEKKNNDLIIESKKIEDNIDVFEEKRRELINKIIESKKKKEKNNNDLLNFEKTFYYGDFQIEQTYESTEIKYKDIILKKYPHNIEKVPFIGDWGCSKIKKEYFDKKNEIEGVWSQKLWDDLGKVKQTECLIEHYSNSFSFIKVDNRFYIIGKKSYEGFINYLFDTKQEKIIETELYFDEIEKIENGKSGTYLLYKGYRGNSGGILFIDNYFNEEILIKNKDYGDFLTITDFELLVDKKIKVFYDSSITTKIIKKEKIIDLSDIILN